MKRNHLYFLLFLLLSFTGLRAQVVSVDPIFPKSSDTIIVTFDATQGNGDLSGVTPVYAHTGVVTSASMNATDWRHVQGNWGTADAKVLMTDIGNNKHQLKYHIRTWYNVPGNETVNRLAFVFRNADGTTVGRASDGSDIFYPVYDGPGLFNTFVSPVAENLIASIGDTIKIRAAASDSATLTIFDNGTQIATGNGRELLHDLIVNSGGNHMVRFVADDGNQTVADTFNYVVNPNLANQNSPAGTIDGINYVNNSTVRLQIFAPGKQYIYVIGDFNGWRPDTAYYMRRTPDQNTFWLEIGGLTPGQEYAFQYFVDGELRIADPYSEVVLDPNNDQFIPTSTYPNLKAYPDGKTTGIATLLQPGRPAYNWVNTSWNRPAKTDLVVYELHLRDFIDAHDYKTLFDTLDYLSNLGVNVIELMPVNEFEGNDSWGYNPSFHMALDKYYGTKEAFKTFVDACHGRGIAVVLDAVFNHGFSQHPLCQLYWDDANFKPDPSNPWLNPDARHPFNVGYDFNHESSATKKYFDRVLEYWLTEYKVDGFRMDLSKGITQVNSGSDVGLWSSYDASRIALLKRFATVAWNVDSASYFILEHFSDNSEERELSNFGMMIWGNHNHNYNEATMGYISGSNFEGMSYQSRGYNDPHLVGYMESHDEERLMYKNLQFGNSNGSYDITNLSTALERVELAAAFFFTIPGPKMFWQFQELGYEVSINFNCRVCPKPIRWGYFADQDRRRLYNVHKALIELKTGYPAFTTPNYRLRVGGVTKTIHLDHATMNVAVLGNFGVTQQNLTPDFQHTGWWYDYFSGDSINVTNTTAQLLFAAGEYHIYTDKRLPKPILDVGVNAEGSFVSDHKLELFPNPTSGNTWIRFNLKAPGRVAVSIFDLSGKQVWTSPERFREAGIHALQWNGLTSDNQQAASGLYFLRFEKDGQIETRKLILQN